MLRILHICLTLVFVATATAAQETPLTQPISEGSGITEPMILEIPDGEFFVLSIHNIDAVQGEYEATVYLSLNSTTCDDERATSNVRMPVGDALFPLMKENPQKDNANNTSAYAPGGPFQFLQFAQGRSTLTAYICDFLEDENGREYGLWQGEFELKGSHRWSTARYPFDKQTLHIEFETPLAADVLQFSTGSSNGVGTKTTGFWGSVKECWRQSETALSFLMAYFSCRNENDPHRDLNAFLKGWKVTSIRPRTYNFDYNSCFGFECTDETDLAIEDCFMALKDETLAREDKENACVDLYSRYSLEVELTRNQNIILPLMLFLGPIFLVLRAGRMHVERVQRNQTGVTSVAVFATGLFGHLTQVGPISFPSVYSVFAIIYLLLFIRYLNTTSKALAEK